MSLFIFGPTIVISLLWLNYLSAFMNTSSETHVIRTYNFIQKHGKGASSIIVNFEDSAYSDFEGPRNFAPANFSDKYESVTYTVGKGIMGIKTIIKRKLNLPKEDNLHIPI